MTIGPQKAIELLAAGYRLDRDQREQIATLLTAAHELLVKTQRLIEQREWEWDRKALDGLAADIDTMMSEYPDDDRSTWKVATKLRTFDECEAAEMSGPLARIETKCIDPTIYEAARKAGQTGDNDPEADRRSCGIETKCIEPCNHDVEAERLGGI